MPDEFRLTTPETRGAPLAAGECQPPRTIVCAGVGAQGIEERKLVEFLDRRRVLIPPDSIVHGELGRHPPRIAHKPGVGMLAGIAGGNVQEGCAAAVHLFQ